MKIQQFVMAYGVEHDRLRALLTPGYTSIRPVLRINAEIREDGSAIPTAVERVYAPVPCTAESAAAIPCTQVLGAYTVIFDRCAG